MKVEIRIVPEREEPAVVVEAPAMTAQAEELAVRWVLWYAELRRMRRALGLKQKKEAH